MLQLLQPLRSAIKIFAFAFVKLVDSVPVLGGLLIVSIPLAFTHFLKNTVKYNLMPPYGAVFSLLSIKSNNVGTSILSSSALQ